MASGCGSDERPGDRTGVRDRGNKEMLPSMSILSPGAEAKERLGGSKARAPAVTPKECGADSGVQRGASPSARVGGAVVSRCSGESATLWAGATSHGCEGGCAGGYVVGSRRMESSPKAAHAAATATAADAAEVWADGVLSTSGAGTVITAGGMKSGTPRQGGEAMGGSTAGDGPTVGVADAERGSSAYSHPPPVEDTAWPPGAKALASTAAKPPTPGSPGWEDAPANNGGDTSDPTVSEHSYPPAVTAAAAARATAAMRGDG